MDRLNKILERLLVERIEGSLVGRWVVGELKGRKLGRLEGGGRWAVPRMLVDMSTQ